MAVKHTFRLPTDVSSRLVDYARQRGITQTIVVEAALASHFSEDGADRLEAALARRLDRLSRQLDRLERYETVTNETLAVFIRSWLTATPALPDGAQSAHIRAKGTERYGSFVEAVGRRLARGRRLADEVIVDVPETPSRATPTT